MSSIHTFLHEPWPQKALPKPELEKLIARLVTRINMGVIATLEPDGQVDAAPLEFYCDGIVPYMYPQPGSSKLRNMAANPAVAFTVNMPYYGFVSAEGLQMKAIAHILEPGTPEHEHGLNVFKWENAFLELGRSIVDNKPKGQVVMLEPVRIQYTSHWLRSEGYAPRQIWYRDQDEVGLWVAKTA